MARAELNANREAWEVGQAIVAAWFKVLANGRMKIGDPEKAELKRVFGEIFKTRIYDVVIDPPNENEGINIVVPQPPDTVHSAPELVEYLRHFHDDGSSRHYHEELGAAVIFGCGKR
ncbi:MAG TPA: hypothetical protein VLB05_06755 [Dongiaceae bacterium]|jgi:hypothetical protein|nr:hypothetical protein [Dongiaceae bacterium]